MVEREVECSKDKKDRKAEPRTHDSRYHLSMSDLRLRLPKKKKKKKKIQFRKTFVKLLIGRWNLRKG